MKFLFTFIFFSVLCFDSFSKDKKNVVAEIKGDKARFVSLEGYPWQNPYVDTIRTEYFQPKNLDVSFWGREYPMFGDFHIRGDEVGLEIFEDRPDLTYKAWFQKKVGPVMFLLPGLGGHYNSETLTAMAEVFYLRGMNVVIIPSAMNWDFMRSASTVPTPGYTPYDARDVYFALQKILEDLSKTYGIKSTQKYLLGYSLGGLHSLYIAKLDSERHEIGFDRIIAVNPPVDMMTGLTRIDKFFENWLAWPKDKVEDVVNKTAMTYLAIFNDRLPPSKPIPMDADKAQFLIGYNFHLILKEIIYSIHEREKLGVIDTPSNWFSKQALFDEITQFTYQKYIDKYLLPYYSRLLDGKIDLRGMNESSGLKNIADTLKRNPVIRVFHNQDDFLLTDGDRKWLGEVLGERLVLFDHGGHLGNLYIPEVQEFIVKAIYN